ncbi:MAG TPA: hypothetical protein VG604_03470, partial [Candidatus Saccharimonadales bacterium]|nr:hypothetical protein [Candidatus Saccharimonadales bacterium]
FDDLDHDLNPLTGFDIDPAHGLLFNFARVLFDGREDVQGVSYDGLLDIAVRRSIEDFSRTWGDDKPHNGRIVSWVGPQTEPVVTDKPTTDKYVLRPIDPSLWKDESPYDANVESASYYQERQKQTLAYAVYDNAGKHDRYNRLIMEESIVEYAHNLPETIADPDLELVFTEVSAFGRVPFIPGYELASISYSRSDSGYRDTFQFKKLDVDPYRQAEVTLPADGQEALAAWYKGIGLDAAAKTLESRPYTISQLVDLIRANSEYTFNDRYAAAYYYDQFENLVDDEGRLQVQCSGAALFLRQSLLQAFENVDGFSARTIGGHFLKPSDRRVSQAQHAQVAITINGEQYILDSTPSIRGNSLQRGLRDEQRQDRQWQNRGKKPSIASQLGNIGNDLGAAWNLTVQDFQNWRSQRREAAAIKKAHKQSKAAAKEANAEQLVPAEPKAAKAEQPLPELETITHQEFKRQNQPDLGRLQSELHEQLEVLLMARDKTELYENALRLSNDDPVRRVLGVATAAVRGELETAELSRLGKYLGNYATADAAVLTEAKLKPYAPETVRYLQGFVGRLLEVASQ